MENNKKYYNIENQYLADAINFVTGLRYYRFTNSTGSTVYSFEETTKFRMAFEQIMKIKHNIASYVEIN